MPITMQTSKPVAVDSPDHQFPLGTAQDNSTDPVFNEALFSLIPAGDVRLLDIGCSGGGFVKSVLDAGGFAVGVEGSDYSLKRRRAEWATIPGNLLTADATVPFQLAEDGRPLKFNVITAWEFLEHISEDDLEGVFQNIHRHLAPQGIVITSVCPISCLHTGKMHHGESAGEGVELHLTAQPETWWRKRLGDAGFTLFDEIKPCFTTFVRGFPRDPDSPVLIFTTPQAKKIPHLFHRVCTDETPSMAANVESWTRHHPDWEWHQWTETDIARLENRQGEALRREILRRHGGVFPDLAVECRQSLEPLLADVTSLVGGEGLGVTLAGIAGHPAFVPHSPSRDEALCPPSGETLCVSGRTLTAYPPGRHAEFKASPATVSVCVPAWGETARLDRCVGSILGQTLEDLQVRILTDTPETFAAGCLLAEQDPRVVIYQCAKANNGGEGWNLGLDLSAGRYLQFVAPTDTLAPATLGRHAAALDRYEHVVVSATAFEVRLHGGGSVPQSAFDRTSLLPTDIALSHAVLSAGVLSHATPLMFRRAALAEHGLRFDPAMHWGAIYDLTLRLLTRGDLYWLHEFGGTVAEATAAPQTARERLRHFRETCRVLGGAVQRTAFPADILGKMAAQVAGAQQDILRAGPRGHTLGEILTDADASVMDGGRVILLELLMDVRRLLTGDAQPARLAA